MQAVWTILSSKQYTDAILYPKEVGEYPLPDKKWIVVLGNDNFITNMRRYGREVVGIDTIYKTTKYVANNNCLLNY